MTLKKCNNKLFVTVGTTKFDDLIKTVCSKSFVEILSKLHFNSVKIQFGRSDMIIDTVEFKEHNIDCEMFQFVKNIDKYIDECDVLLCHGGSATILEGLEKCKLMIVVPNTTLQDNHQLELAGSLAAENYLLFSKVENLKDLFTSELLLNFQPRVRKKGNPKLLNDYLIKKYINNSSL